MTLFSHVHRETDVVCARHSTGRGGLANLTGVQSPPPERLEHQPGEYETTGRGGVGNFRSRSSSRDASSPRSPSGDRIMRMWQKVTHQHDPRIDEESAAPVAVGDGGPNHPE